MLPRLVLLTVLVALAGVAGVMGCTITVREQNKEETSPAPRPIGQQFLGAGSCASTGCHNANGFKGDVGSEYTTWIAYDKHARAYEVLFNADSRKIIKNLYHEAERSRPAHEQTLCLNCHVHADYAQA